MANSVKIQMALGPDTVEKLDKMASEKGLKRSALVSVLINEKWKEEQAEK